MELTDTSTRLDRANYEKLVQWFESVYRGKPIEVDIFNEDGSYRCTIYYAKKETKVNKAGTELIRCAKQEKGS